MTHAELARALPELPASDAVLLDASLVAGTIRDGNAAWYDAFELADGRIAVVIGNAAGSSAAARIPACIAAVRDIFTRSPATAGAGRLREALDTVLDLQSAGLTAAATVGVVDAAGRTFTYMTSGQLPPFVRYADGQVACIPVESLPNMGDAEHPPAEVVLDLADVALLVLYSASLVEDSRDRDGLQRVQAVLSDPQLIRRGRPVAWLERRLLAGRVHGDVALLALTFRSRPIATVPPAPGVRPLWSVSWAFEATGSLSNGARRAFMGYLQSKQSAGRPADALAAELIFGELLGNVVRHAPGRVEITLDWTTDAPVLHVMDNGPGFSSRRLRERLPDDDWSESGRGLFIINACATSFCVRNRPGRGTHASATLPLA